MHKAIPLVSLLFCSSAFSAENNPIIGAWEWNPNVGKCTEIHTYKVNAIAFSKSGAEVLKKNYSVTKLRDNVYRITKKIVASNGGRDCLGKRLDAGTYDGPTKVNYIIFSDRDSYETCASESKATCYGIARRIHSK
jgi:hypothetical protein